MLSNKNLTSYHNWLVISLLAFYTCIYIVRELIIESQKRENDYLVNNQIAYVGNTMEEQPAMLNQSLKGNNERRTLEKNPMASQIQEKPPEQQQLQQ